VFGITAKCRSEGSALDNTIATKATGHYTTFVTTSTLFKHETIFITSSTTKTVCAGISTVTVTGNVLGIITSPACGASSKELKVSFTATGSTQNALTYTGVNYDLKSYTGTETANEKTAALVGTMTFTTSNAQKLNCT
jgi:hypothetical protein